MTPLHLHGLTHLRSLTWNDVFAIWRANEGDDSHWGPHARERGFPDWAAWRMSYATPLRCPEREWHLFRIDNPFVSVPTFLGGPFRSWRERFYGGVDHPTFATLAEHASIQTHGTVLDMIAHFPMETTITGLRTDHGVIVIEGMHRCSAIALAAARGQHVATTMTIALADASGETLPPVGRAARE